MTPPSAFHSVVPSPGLLELTSIPPGTRITLRPQQPGHQQTDRGAGSDAAAATEQDQQQTSRPPALPNLFGHISRHTRAPAEIGNLHLQAQADALDLARRGYNPGPLYQHSDEFPESEDDYEMMMDDADLADEEQVYRFVERLGTGVGQDDERRLRGYQVMRGQMASHKRVASRKAVKELESVDIKELSESERSKWPFSPDYEPPVARIC